MSSGVCRGSSGGGGSQERVTLKQLVKSPADMPSPDAKPEYHNAICTVANIDPQQSMYYQACPDNNRKVRPASHSVLGACMIVFSVVYMWGCTIGFSDVCQACPDNNRKV